MERDNEQLVRNAPFSGNIMVTAAEKGGMWTWYDLPDDRGVLELNASDPALELEQMLHFEPDGRSQAVWIHSLTGRPLAFPEVGVA